MRFLVSAATNAGIIKEKNQDSACVKIARTQLGDIMLAVVCDGMGGLSRGELASATVIKAFINWFENDYKYNFMDLALKDIEKQWRSLISQANTELKSYGEDKRCSLGTTLTAMLFFKEQYVIVNVGDSRIYEVYDSVHQLTEDQTLVNREYKRGNITKEQMLTDSRRNVLLQCIGASKVVEPEFTYGFVKTDAIYMLCSDGLRHKISNDEFMAKLSVENLSDEKLTEICRELIETNMKRQERDNITVVLAKPYSEV